MRIGKVSNFVNFLSNNKNFQVKQKGIDFTATKFVQVAQRVLVTTAIAIECYVTNYEADHQLYF